MQMANSAQLAVLASSVVTVGSFEGDRAKTCFAAPGRKPHATKNDASDLRSHPAHGGPSEDRHPPHLRRSDPAQAVATNGMCGSAAWCLSTSKCRSGNRRIHRGQSHAALRNEGSRRRADFRVRTRTQGRRGIPHRIRQTTQFLGSATASCSSWAAALFIH